MISTERRRAGMNEREVQALGEVSEQLAAAMTRLDEIVAARQAAWTLDDLRRDLDQWKRYLQNATNADGDPYSEHSVKSHIGHSAQFIRWLAGEWQPTGPRRRP